jgi:hypothetical protein
MQVLETLMMPVYWYTDPSDDDVRYMELHAMDARDPDPPDPFIRVGPVLLSYYSTTVSLSDK